MSDSSETTRMVSLPARIGHYAIVRKLGEGGMGVVYAARDERLQRTVALKTMSSRHRDETRAQAVLARGRAAASVNHPNVCQIYEIGEDDGELFIAMELLEGEALSERLGSGPLQRRRGGADRARHARRALGASRARHRPSRSQAVEHVSHAGTASSCSISVWRARSASRARSDDRPDHARHRAWARRATWRPEQVTRRAGRRPHAICSPWARSCSRCWPGGRAFAGRTVVEILHATLTTSSRRRSPARRGRGASTACIRRALAKKPAERPAVRRGDGRGAARHSESMDERQPPVLARALTRARRAAVPRPASRSRNGLSGVQPAGRDHDVARRASGRSSCARALRAARFAGEAPDLKALAAEADVDRVVMGTLLRSGDQLRAVGAARRGAGRDAAHLAHRPGAARRPVPAAGRHRPARGRRAGAAAGGRERHRPRPMRRTTPRAYELYLRRTSSPARYGGLPEGARAVRAEPRARPELRPGVGAPRALPSRDRQVHRRRRTTATAAPSRHSAGRSSSTRDLTLAHKFYANLEAETGQPRDALVRLAGRGQAPRQRPRALRGARPRLPLLRALRAVDRRARRGAAARPERAVRASSRRC